MNGLVNGISIEIERSWTWVYGKTFPVKEELKAQGFLWSPKRKGWYNRSIVEVKLNNGNNGHKGVKPTQRNTEHAQEPKTTIEMVKVRIPKELPTFQGIDGKIYKLKEGVTELPKENAEVLIKRGVATKEIELSEHDKALIEGNYKIEGKPSEEKEVKTQEAEKPVNETWKMNKQEARAFLRDINMDLHERAINEALEIGLTPYTGWEKDYPTLAKKYKKEEEEKGEGYTTIGQIDSTVLKEVAGFLSNIEPSIYPLHVNKEGWDIDFVDLGNTLAGEIEITKDAWFGYWDMNDMELTFDTSRVKNMFATMKKEVAEIGFDEYNMIANWGTLIWTHKLCDVDTAVKPPHIKDFEYPVKLTIGKLTIADIKKKLKEAKKELERYDSWAGVVLQYKEESSLPPSLKDQFGIYAYRFSWDSEGKNYLPTLKPIIELSGVQFDLDTDKREPSKGIYSFDNFEKLLKGIKSDVTVSFGDETPLKAEFEIRQGVKVVTWQASDNLDEGDKRKLMSTNIEPNEKVDEIARIEGTRVFIPKAKRKTLIPKREFFLIDLVSKIVELNKDELAQIEPIGLLKTLNLVEREKRISFDAEGEIIKQEVISEKEPNIEKISELVSKYNELHEIENKAWHEWVDYPTEGGGEENEESIKLKEKWQTLIPEKRMEEMYLE